MTNYNRSPNWESKVNNINLLVYLDVLENRPDYSKKLFSIKGVSNITSKKDKLWTNFSFVVNGITVYGSLFVKRMILTIPYENSEKKPLITTLNWGLDQKEFLILAGKKIAKQITGTDKGFKYHPLIECGKIETSKGLFSKKTKKGTWPEWVDDGLTSFHIQAFDSNTSKVGTIRISRHITICYGISKSLLTDMVNLIYEEMLYKKGPVDKDAVFSLLSALTKYVLPTEVDLFLHQMSSRIAVYLVIIGIILSIISKIYDELIILNIFNNNITMTIVLYGFSAILLWIIWRLLGVLKVKNK